MTFIKYNEYIISSLIVVIFQQIFLNLRYEQGANYKKNGLSIKQNSTIHI